ncbi:hypothetical protein QL285_017847 [Trifolium repens]|nr:hypothetical protein QL285_097438 [Trifolium repens]KAK2378644.1 hypothetical protein QL285_066528 [Trifolium repens]KAK2432455.1 hypothetical protein QL285_017847 [Trifolium repens]
MNTSFPSMTLVVGSTLRRISATNFFVALKILQHLCGKHPSMRYSIFGLSCTSTVTVVLDRAIIDDLLTLKIGLSPSFLSPLNPSHL